MKAIICREYGPPERLEYGDIASPVPGPGEVRLRVQAAGVNFPDVLVIENQYQFRRTLPFVPGGELCGVVEEVGAGVNHLKIGERVVAFTLTGAFAEECVASADACYVIPDSMSAAAAAGFLIAYGTTIHALQDRGQLRPGESLLVLGASGGVGLAALQIGKLIGATVIAAASSAEKLALCREQGADALVNYSQESLKHAVNSCTGGRGADVIYDPVGGTWTQEVFSCINWNGRHLILGFAGGPIPSVALNRLLLKGCATIGVFWAEFCRRDPRANRSNIRRLLDWFEAGKLTPVISREYPLSDGARAIQDLAERKALGKVILRV